MRRKLTIAAFLAAAVLTADAGVPQSPFSPEAEGYVCRGRLMLDNSNPGGAIDQLREALAPGAGLSSATGMECRYMQARALYEQGDARCLPLLEEIAAALPGSHTALLALVARADFLFFSGEYGRATAAYSAIDLEALGTYESEACTLRYAVSLIRIGEYARGAGLLAPLAGKKNDLGEAARYYMAYTEYCRGRLSVARKMFAALDRKRLERSAVSGRLMSPDYADPDCYLAQIDYAGGIYAEGATRAIGALGHNLSPAMRAEMQRVAGECLFRLGRYSEALPYLEGYVSASGIDHASSALYAMGVVLYSEHDYSRAEKVLAPVAGMNDAEGQGAAFTLGQCRMALGRTEGALKAYRMAADREFDRKVAETALYDMIAAGTETDKPDAGLMNEFIRRFPDSPRAAEVAQTLGELLYMRADYAGALAALDLISSPGAGALLVKQKTLYRLGTSALKERRPAQAAAWLQRASDMSSADGPLTAQCRLWLGEALLAQKKYAAAERQFRLFTAAVPKGKNAALGQYDLASALYMQKKFKEARPHYQRAAAMFSGTDARLRADALVRAADCANYTGDVGSAEASYSEAIEADASSGYARLQRARMYGLQGKYADKLAELESILDDAEVGAQALLEKGRALVELGRKDEAAEAFRSVAARHPSSPEARQALLQRAIIFAGAGKDGEAEKAYREILERWPTSEEAHAAHQDLAQLSARLGRLADYKEFLSRIPGAPALDAQMADDLAFEAAARELEENRRATGIEDYLSMYPAGRHAAEARRMLEEVSPMLRFEKAAAMINYSPGEALAILEALATEPDTEYGARAAVSIAEYRLSKGQSREARRLMEQFTERGSEQEYWLARGFITLSDALAAQGEKSLAREYLRGLMSNYTATDDDIRDMINNRLKKLK